MPDRPYFRVYYVDFARDYPQIYRDNDAFATYVRLGAVAEAMWPSVAEVPRSERSSFVKKLVDASLVRLVPPYGFTIKGMEAERGARSNAARHAASTRWSNAAGPAAGSAETMPNRAEPNRAAHAHSAPKTNGHIVDPQTQTPEEYQREREAALRRAGLPVDPS